MHAMKISILWFFEREILSWSIIVAEKENRFDIGLMLWAFIVHACYTKGNSFSSKRAKGLEQTINHRYYLNWIKY